MKKTPLLQKYSPKETLALIIDTNLTKEHHIKIQRGGKTRGGNIYPAYNVISEVQKVVTQIILQFLKARLRYLF